MRGWLASAALALATGALAAPQAARHPARPVAVTTRDWTTVVSRTPAGATVIGNPAAPVKLAEYISYTCPHCAAFTAASNATLKGQWVRGGTVSIEVRPVAGQPLDLAAAMLARCIGPRFSAFTDTVFAQQPTWFDRGANWQATNGTRIGLYPLLARLRAVADGAGLTDMARAAGGLTPAAIDRCFATDADLKTIAAITASANIEGTPSFVLNGKPVGSATWATLEPQLRAAGAH